MGTVSCLSPFYQQAGSLFRQLKAWPLEPECLGLNPVSPVQRYLPSAPVLSVKGSIYRVAVKLKMENAENRVSRIVSTGGLAIICGCRR